MSGRVLVVDGSSTVRRLVSATLGHHGFETAHAVDEYTALELARGSEPRPDVIIADVSLPNGDARRFFAELRDARPSAPTPVVVMGADADAARDVAPAGAEILVKPFRPTELLAAVEQALALSHNDQEPHEPGAEPDSLESSATEAPTRRTHVAQVVATHLANLCVHVREQRPTASRAELADALTEVLVQEGLAEIIEATAPTEGGTQRERSALSGDAAIIPVPAALDLLASQRASGQFVFSRGNSQFVVSFRLGLIDLVHATGVGDEFRLGRFFVSDGAISPTDIEHLIARDRQGALQALEGRRLLVGSLLLQSGRINEYQLRSALVRQSTDLVCEILRRPRGTFEFRVAPPSIQAETASLGLSVALTVSDAEQLHEEWTRIEEKMGDFDTVFAQEYDADPRSLRPIEQRVLRAVDGQRSVREVVTAARTTPFEACRALVALQEAKIVGKVF